MSVRDLVFYERWQFICLEMTTLSTTNSVKISAVITEASEELLQQQ